MKKVKMVGLLSVLGIASTMACGVGVISAYANTLPNGIVNRFTLDQFTYHNKKETVWISKTSGCETAYGTNRNPQNEVVLPVKMDGADIGIYVPQQVYDFYKEYPQKLAHSDYEKDWLNAFVQGFVPSTHGVRIGQTIQSKILNEVSI